VKESEIVGGVFYVVKTHVIYLPHLVKLGLVSVVVVCTSISCFVFEEEQVFTPKISARVRGRFTSCFLDDRDGVPGRKVCNPADVLHRTYGPDIVLYYDPI